jgi:hypothetical protein
MKELGRSNNGLRLDARLSRCSPRTSSNLGRYLLFSGALSLLSLVRTVPVYADSIASSSEGSSPRTVDPAAADELSDEPANLPRPSSAASSSAPVVARPSTMVPAASPVDSSGLISETPTTDLPLQSAGQGQETTTEIPQALMSSPDSAAVASVPQQAGVEPSASAAYDDGIIRYEKANDTDLNGPPIGTLQDFMSEGDITSPLGIEVREDRRRLKSGIEAQGLLIIDVFAGSPAARAGLHPYHRAMRDALETAAVAGAMFCPPVVLLVPVFDQVRLGESYDLIIGVDGSRVTNLLDFEERLRDVQAGEIVYFSVVRNGDRLQVPVQVPENLLAPAF